MADTLEIPDMQTPSCTGDIILFSKPQKSANIFVQSILRRKNAKHHHVAIALYNHSLIHAMPKLGIHLCPLVEYLNENKEFVVFRHVLALDEKNSEYLEDRLRYHHRQNYSLLNAVYTSWRHSFCSELAAKVYENSVMQLTHGNKKPKAVLPVDIYDYLESSFDWVDMTLEYQDFYFDNPESGSLRLGAEIEQRIVGYGQQMGFSQQQLINKINSIRTAQEDCAEPLTAPMSFWTNRLVGRITILNLFWYWAKMLRSLICPDRGELKRASPPRNRKSCKERHKSD
ncbi:hypothetical protein [Pseudomonas syringae]|uniref:hypothetical protein n=1 Tax=Pseudomonas syringae TaxID=317 RepID=UPI00128EA24A|nr:hypothetical protein [Pseudomonas syringae]